MPREGTKAAEIMRLYNHGIFTIQEIAESVGCHDSYVRVVARQRMGSGSSVHDSRNRKRAYANGDRDAARSAYLVAYHDARRKGLSARKASTVGGGAYTKVMVTTGRRKAAAHA